MKITCAICQKSLDNVNDVVTLREKGSEGINRASRERNDLIQTVPGQKLHQTCHREYCHPSNINRAKKKELNILCCRPVLKGRTSGRKWYDPEYYMFMVTIHGNGQHPTHLHQGRTQSKLGAPSSNSLRNVTMPCCIGSQPVRQVRAIISSVNEQSS